MGSGLADSIATSPAWPPRRSTAQIQAVDKADELHRRHHLLLSGVGVSETRAASLLVEMPEPEVLHGIGEMVAYAGLNPRHLD